MSLASTRAMRVFNGLLLCTLGLTACEPAVVSDAAEEVHAGSYAIADAPECGFEAGQEPWVRYESGCPQDNTCQIIDQPGDAFFKVELPADCHMTNVQFKIVRSHVDLDCSDNTLAGGNTGVAFIVENRVGGRVHWSEPQSCANAPALGICTDTLEELAPVNDVTVHDCNITGYENGVLVRLAKKPDSDPSYPLTYLSYFHHRNERECRMNQMDDCMRRASPYNIRFDNVDVEGSAKTGVRIFTWVHDVTFRGGTVRDGGGVGIYLSPGSQGNTIENNQISGNQREGIALDGSANNLVTGNTLASNRHDLWVWHEFDPTGTAEYYNVGITVFKNAWEGRNFADATLGDDPRNQHASGNVIEGNTIEDQDTGIWIAYRQGKSYSDNDRGDPVYYVAAHGRNFKKFAEDTVVTSNYFVFVRVGVRVQDDGAVVTGNTFSEPPDYDHDSVGVFVGHDVRRAAGEPVKGALVRDNVFSFNLDYGVIKQECTFENVVENNRLGSANGPLASVHQWGCGEKQARLGRYLSNADNTIAGLSGLRTGAFFQNGHKWLAGDFDADGLDDLVSIYVADDDRTRIWLHLNDGTKFAYQDSFQTLVESMTPTGGQWVAGNFDGVGGDDLVYIYGNSTTTYVWSWRAEGVGFSPGPRTVNGPSTVTVLSNTPYAPTHRWLAGRVDLDGREDLVQVHPNASGGARVVVHRSVDGERFDLQTSAQAFGTFRTADQWLLADIDGDGRKDLLQLYADAAGKTVVTWRKAGSSGFATNSWTGGFLNSAGVSATFSPNQRWVVSDFNGNQRDDLVLIYGVSGQGRVWRNRSTGGGLVHVSFQVLNESFSTEQAWVSGQFSAGDDLEDLALVYPRVYQ